MLLGGRRSDVLVFEALALAFVPGRLVLRPDRKRLQALQHYQKQRATDSEGPSETSTDVQARGTAITVTEGSRPSAPQFRTGRTVGTDGHGPKQGCQGCSQIGRTG